MVSSTLAKASSIKIPPSKKFYLAVSIAGRDRAFFVDSGSDISLCPKSWAGAGEVEELSHSFRVGGYDEKSQQRITHRVKLKMNFIGVVKSLNFFLADVKTALIGNDILMNPNCNVSLNTKNSIISVNRLRIPSSMNSALAMKELERRRSKSSNQQEKIIHQNPKATSSFNVKVTPRSHERLVLTCQSTFSGTNSNVFLSDLDENDSIYVPSVICDIHAKSIETIVVNNTDSDVIIKKGASVRKGGSLL